MSETTKSPQPEAFLLALILLISCASIAGCEQTRPCESELDDIETESSLLELPLDCGSHRVGHKLARHNRIAGGYNASPGEFPSYVKLRIFADKYHYCGGSLISDRLLITAAHCLVYNETVKNVTVFAGSVERNSDRGHSAKLLCISREYKQFDEDIDLAIIVLDKPVVFDNDTQPVCLPHSEMEDEMQAFVVGMGFSSKNPKPQSADYLQVLPVKRSWCVVPVSRNSICFNATGPSYLGDACEGDSGGAVYVEIDDKQTLVGVVSGGINICQPGLSLPGFYADVYRLRDTIGRMLKNCN